MGTKEKGDGKKVIARNKKAFADFEMLETIEAGMVLTGGEIKSARQGKVNLKGSYVHIFNCEAWANGIHIPAYPMADQKNYDPKQKRKLLLHRHQINKLQSAQEQKSQTIIPLELYLKKGRAKLLIATARGKKKYDRRQELKKKAQEMEIRRAVARRSGR